MFSDFIYLILNCICNLTISIAGIAVSFGFIKSSKNSAKEPVMRVLIGFFGMLITKVILSIFIGIISNYINLIFNTDFYFNIQIFYKIPILGNAKIVLNNLNYLKYGEYVVNHTIHIIFYAISTAIEAGYFYLLATKPADEIIPVVKTYVDKLSNKPAAPTVETPAVEKEEKPTPKAKPSKPIDTEALLKYKKLLDVGAITQEEFDQKKKEIMGD